MPAENGNGYWVLEGNRRLAAVMVLLEPSRAPRRRNAVEKMAEQATNIDALRELPCVLFEQRSDVLDYLGYRHITGIKQWEPDAKARYLKELYEEHLPTAGDDVFRVIARIIGSRADYVMRMLGALRLYEVILENTDLDEEDVAFSIITLALTYSAVVGYLGLGSLAEAATDPLDVDRVRTLSKWLFVQDAELGRTQLGDSRNMKLLAAAIGHSEGMAALTRGERAEEAAQATIDVSDVFLRSLRTARDRLMAAQALVHRAEVPSEAQRLLQEIEDLALQLMTLAQRRSRRIEREDVQ